MSERAMARVIETRDLTPIPDINKDDEVWLRQLAKDAKTDSLTLKLSRRDKEDAEPVVFFNERFGNWWAGRYIGEVQYQGRSL